LFPGNFSGRLDEWRSIQEIQIHSVRFAKLRFIEDHANWNEAGEVFIAILHATERPVEKKLPALSVSSLFWQARTRKRAAELVQT